MITPRTLIYLRNVQMSAEGRERAARTARINGKRRKLNTDRFNRLLADTVIILETYTFSKFEFEAACRHGLRSTLCEEGWRWADADAQAVEIVSAGLARIGAVRPPWAEGQPDFAIPNMIERTRCVRCGDDIPEGKVSNNGQEVKYCGDSCKRMAGVVLRRLHGEKQTVASYLAACAVKSQRTFEELARNCEACGTRFLTADRRSKFCSRPCFSSAQVKFPTRECEVCATPFKPKREGARFCSKPCAGQRLVKPLPTLSCAYCAGEFRPKTAGQQRMFCSNPCRISGQKSGIATPRTRFQCEDVTT